MKNKFVLGIFFFLILMTSSVFASMVENSRQGSPAISAEMHPESTPQKPGTLLGFELRFLGFCIRSGIIYTDPFGLEVVAIFDKAAGTLTVTDQQTKQTVSIQNVFSGQTGAQEWQKNVGPIPNGPYIIGLGFNAKPGSTGDYQWYPVFGLDSSMDPRQRPAVTVKDPSGKDISRGGFFIHTGSVSLGCVTIKSDVECGPDYPKSSGYDQLKTLVDKTKPLEFKDGKFSGWLYVK